MRLDGAALLSLVRAGVKFIDDGAQEPSRKTHQQNEAAPGGSRLSHVGRSRTRPGDPVELAALEAPSSNG